MAKHNYKKYNEKKKIVEASNSPLEVENPISPDKIDTVNVDVSTKPTTDSEYIQYILNRFNIKPDMLVHSLGIGSVSLIKDIISGKYNLIDPFKSHLINWVNRQKRNLNHV